MIKVLFVCMGNICRSPTAQGMLSKLLEESGLQDRVYVDSAGTHAYHVGEPPDERSMRAAAERGIDLRKQRARRVTVEDFNEFDYVLAMDRENYAALGALCPVGCENKLNLFLTYASHLDLSDVPDPYYGGPTGFDRVLDLVEVASRGLLEEIQCRLNEVGL